MKDTHDWVASILPYLPDLLVPDDADAIRRLFEGNARGEIIPWGVWLRPLLFKRGGSYFTVKGWRPCVLWH